MSKDLIQNLLNECTKMLEFDHPNVLTLTGVCLDGGPTPYLVMPFMFNGSLLSYLKKGRDSLVLQTHRDDVSFLSGGNCMYFPIYLFYKRRKY